MKEGMSDFEKQRREVLKHGAAGAAFIGGFGVGAAFSDATRPSDQAPESKKNPENSVLLTSPQARETLTEGNPESIETARGMIRAYAGMLGMESNSCSRLEEQLQEILDNPDKKNEKQKNLLLCGIRLSIKQQEVYKNAMEELEKLVRPHLKNLKPEMGTSPKKPVKNIEM